MSNIENIKRRVIALSNMTTANGASEAESLFAAQKMGELMMEYNLSMSDIEVKAIKCITKEVKHIGRNLKAVDYSIVAIAKYLSCKTWTRSQKHNVTHVMFFGEPASVDMAEYLYRLLEVTVEIQSRNFKDTLEYNMAKNKKRALMSFQQGMISRICNRLREMGVEAYKNLNSTQNALVVSKDKVVEEQFAELGMNLKDKNAKAKTVDYDSYAAGQRVGNNVNLSRPIENSSKNVLKIT